MLLLNLTFVKSMVSKNKKGYTPGMEDIERVFEHLSTEEKKAKREAWLKEHYSKQAKRPNTKGATHEGDCKP